MASSTTETQPPENWEEQLKRFSIDFSKAYSRKDVLFLLSQGMKPLPMVAAAFAWEEFAKRLEKMADEGSPRTPKFRELIIQLYAAYYRGAAYWLKHGMPGATIDTERHPTLEDILGVSAGEETACNRCGELFLPTEGEYETSLCPRCRSTPDPE